MKKPNFFIIGAPKCGTTALSEYLREHPEVFFSEPKEPHFFNEDFADRYTTTMGNYMELFDAAGAHHKAVGEGSVFYLSSSVAVKQILAFQPAARFVVMLRNPADMAYSLHSQALYSFGEDVVEFEMAWRLQKARSQGHCMPRFCREPKRIAYADLCAMGKQLHRLYETVSSDRIKVIFFDDFVADTQSTYNEVLAFLKLSSDRRTEFPPANVSRTFKSRRLDRITRYGGACWVGAKRRFGIDVKLRVSGWIKKMNTVEKRRPPLTKEFSEELRLFFRDDVYELSQLTGRDLSHWVD